MSEVIGKRIKALRIKNGYTQEELGNILGVTTQAVSKWERGGTPDTELLPEISELFGVSIDHLFGLDKKEQLDAMISREISGLEPEEAFRRAFELCWAIDTGISSFDSANDTLSPSTIDTIKSESGQYFLSRLLLDEGMITAKMNTDSRYFFLIPKPEKGYNELFQDIDDCLKLFSILAEKEVFQVLSFMYKRMNTPVSLSLISIKTNIDKNTLLPLMKKMEEARLVVCIETETENGILKSYTYSNEPSLLPLMAFAKEICNDKPINFFTNFMCNKPLFK